MPTHGIFHSQFTVSGSEKKLNNPISTVHFYGMWKVAILSLFSLLFFAIKACSVMFRSMAILSFDWYVSLILSPTLWMRAWVCVSVFVGSKHIESIWNGWFGRNSAKSHQPTTNDGTKVWEEEEEEVAADKEPAMASRMSQHYCQIELH